MDTENTDWHVDEDGELVGLKTITLDVDEIEQAAGTIGIGPEELKDGTWRRGIAESSSEDLRSFVVQMIGESENLDYLHRFKLEKLVQVLLEHLVDALNG